MVKIREVTGHSEFVTSVVSADTSTDPVYMLFYGGPSSEDSWCPDCNKAKPVIDEVVKSKAPENSVFVHVNVGERAKWKSPDCEFRTSPPFPVTKIPTLVRWDTKQALTEEECADKLKVESIF